MSADGKRELQELDKALLTTLIDKRVVKTPARG